MKLQRNDLCPCGSGKKYKKCCFLDEGKNAEITKLASMAHTPAELADLLSRPRQVYRLKVTLKSMLGEWMEEEISRTIEAEENETLYGFHLEIQHAFDWDNDHLFSFYLGNNLYDSKNEYSGDPFGEHLVSDFGEPTKSAAATQIRDLKLKQGLTFLYRFDYGDDLVHEIYVEAISDKSSDMRLPRVVSAVGTPPPQYGIED